MKYASSLSVRAEKELEASFIWYEEQQRGLGGRFIEEISGKIDKIVQNPELYSVKYKSYREAGLATFPYLIVYRINKKTSYVLSHFSIPRRIREKNIGSTL